MKTLLVIVVLLALLASCTKENNSVPTSIADEFVTNWKVYENVTASGRFIQIDTFYSNSVKRNDSTFGVVQSNRRPVPYWVGSGPSSADTLWFKPVTVGRKLINNAQGNLGTYSQKKDALTFGYLYGAGSAVYNVSQSWIRQ